jgi:hypothetical protein
MFPELAIGPLECLISQQKIALLKCQLRPQHSVSTERAFQGVQLAEQCACSRQMALIFPARKGPKNLAFALESSETILKPSQGLVDRLFSPGTATGWLRWTCGAFHLRSPVP